MAMGSGSKADINVTPLIDVLLVLLIIFMVIVPVVPKGLDALVPQPPKSSETGDTRPVVVQVSHAANGQPTYRINQDSFAQSAVEPKLAQIFATRVEKVLFVQGDADLQYGSIAEVIDMGHQAGVDNIGIITPRVEAGQ